MNRPGNDVRANGFPLPWGVKIGLAIALFVFAFVAGAMSELPGDAAWWIYKGCFVAATAALALLVLDARASRNGLTTTAMPHAEGPTLT
jgi:multidrug transporter EmrE-like cation transporter